MVCFYVEAYSEYDHEEASDGLWLRHCLTLVV